jgi:hypothetical protein
MPGLKKEKYYLDREGVSVTLTLNGFTVPSCSHNSHNYTASEVKYEVECLL